MASSLLKSTGVVGAMTMMSRVLGFVRDVMFARAFGAGAGMDAFLVALTIPNFGRRMFAEGAFAQAFVPVFTETKMRQPHDDVRDLVAVVMGTLGGVLAVVTLAGCLAAPLLVLLFASGFAGDPAKAALGAELLRWTFPYLMFISLTAMAGSVLNSYGRFGVPAATPVILNICLIAATFVDSGSVRVLAIAVFVAGLLQFAVQLPSLARLSLLPRPRWGWRDLRVRRIVGLMGPVIIGSSVGQISLLVNYNLATQLGDGPVSWLYYADRLMEFPLGIFSIALGTVILPALSAHHAEQAPADFSATLDWGLRALLVIATPAALGLLLAAGPLVATIFGHGEFEAHDVRMTTMALWAYAAGFMGFSLVKVLVPGFYARQDMRTPMNFGIVSFGAGIAVSLGLYLACRLLDVDAAHAALAAGTSFTACLNGLLLLLRLRRDGVFVPQPGWRAYLARLLLANGALAVVVVSLAGPLDGWLDADALDRALRLGGVVVGGAVAYFGVLAVAGMRLRHLRRGA